MNIPLRLTFLRVLAIPFIVIIYMSSFNWSHMVASILFLAAIITDWLDGYLARRWQQETRLGAFLDPVADKLLVCVCLVLVASFYHKSSITIAVVVIIAREIFISALREWMAEVGQRSKVSVMFIGKAKTALQAIALIALLMYDSPLSQNIMHIGIWCLYLALILTVWSMFLYVKSAWPQLSQPASN